MNDETLTKLLIDHNRRNSSFFGCHSPSPPAEGWTICWLNKLFLHLLRQSCVADTHLQCGLVLEVASFIVRSWTILKFLSWMACWPEESRSAKWSLGRVEPPKVIESWTLRTVTKRFFPKRSLEVLELVTMEMSVDQGVTVCFFWSTEASYILDSHYFCRTFDCKSTSPKEEANIRGGCRSNRSSKTSVLSSVAAKMAWGVAICRRISSRRVGLVTSV